MFLLLRRLLYHNPLSNLSIIRDRVLFIVKKHSLTSLYKHFRPLLLQLFYIVCSALQSIMDMRGFYCNGRRIYLPLDLMPIGQTYALGVYNLRPPTVANPQIRAALLLVHPDITTPSENLPLRAPLQRLLEITDHTAQSQLIDGVSPISSQPATSVSATSALVDPLYAYPTTTAISYPQPSAAVGNPASTTLIYSTATQEEWRDTANLLQVDFSALTAPPIVTMPTPPPAASHSSSSTYYPVVVPLTPPPGSPSDSQCRPSQSAGSPPPVSAPPADMPTLHRSFPTVDVSPTQHSSASFTTANFTTLPPAGTCPPTCHSRRAASPSLLVISALSPGQTTTCRRVVPYSPALSSRRWRAVTSQPRPESPGGSRSSTVCASPEIAAAASSTQQLSPVTESPLSPIGGPTLSAIPQDTSPSGSVVVDNDSSSDGARYYIYLS